MKSDATTAKVADADTFAAIESPTRPGWYGYSGGRNVLIFLLDGNGQWWAITDYGEMARCEWGYISQALSVFDLLLLASLR